MKGKLLSRVQLFTTPWTAAYQAPPSMGFSRQEYWSGVPLPSPELRHTIQENHQAIKKEQKEEMNKEEHKQLVKMVVSTYYQ